MSGLILDRDINGADIKELDAGQWLEKLIEAIKEDLLSPEQAADLLNHPSAFLKEYADSQLLGNQIYNRIVTMFFAQMFEMKERKKNKQKTLKDFVLNTLETKLTDTDSISPVDMSHIYKNLKD